MPTALQELADKIRGKRSKLATYYGREKDGDGRLKVSEEERGEMKSINDELNDLVPKFETMNADHVAAERNAAALKSMTDPRLPEGIFGTDGAGTDARGHVKGFGELITESEGYKSLFDGNGLRTGRAMKFAAEVPANLKTLFTRTQGWNPQIIRQPGYVESAQQQPALVDLIPSANTTAAGVSWMLEDQFTNNAAPVAEAGPYPESAFHLAEQITRIRKIAHFIPTTDEALADVTGCRDYLDNRLTLGLKQALDRQVATGDNTGENLQGLFTLNGMQTQAQGKDAPHDAIFKLITLIQSNAFANPNGIWLHPLDWMNIRLYKTAQGQYLFGNPDQVGVARLWGINVASSTFVPQGKALAGDFAMYSTIYYRAGVAVEVSNSHADYFTNGKLAIRAQLRAALICTRPSAFGVATLNAGGVPATS